MRREGWSGRRSFRKNRRRQLGPDGRPKNPGPGLAPGMCPSQAHDRENLGMGGRRVQVSRAWSGKTLKEHKADRASVVREVLAAAGVEMQEANRLAADVMAEDGRPRFIWEEIPISEADYVCAGRATSGSPTPAGCGRSPRSAARPGHGPTTNAAVPQVTATRPPCAGWPANCSVSCTSVWPTASITGRRWHGPAATTSPPNHPPARTAAIPRDAAARSRTARRADAQRREASLRWTRRPVLCPASRSGEHQPRSTDLPKTPVGCLDGQTGNRTIK